LEEAMELFKLPRTLGELEGKAVKASEGRFGPYVQHGSVFASIKKDSELDPLTITYEQAVELIAQKKIDDAKKLIKVFEEDEDMTIKEGRWGAYIKYKKENVKIPKEKKEREVAATMTFEECKKLVDAHLETKGKSGKKKTAKKAPKKATKKKATAKDSK